MAQSLTAKLSSLTRMSDDDKDTELLWMTQMIETIRNLKDDPSADCCVIVGESRIPVHKTVVQLNSSMLTSKNVEVDALNEVTEIEVEPEFDDQPDLVKNIVTSFYSGTIDIGEGSIKEVYKFSTFYEIKWLKIHAGRLISNYLTKSIYGCYERFTEIFSLAQFIWDTDLFEICIQVIDEDILELLMKDDEMLGRMSYRCMEIITTSPNVEFPEKDLFDLLVAWAMCKKQKCKKSFQDLFENLNYESINKMFIIERVMTYVSQNEGIFSVSFLKKMQEGMSDSSKDMCRSERRKEYALNRVQVVLNNIESSDKRQEKIFSVNEVNSFLIRKDIRYLADEMKEKLSYTILNKAYGSLLRWESFVNLINHHQTESTASLLFYHYFDFAEHEIYLHQLQANTHRVLFGRHEYINSLPTYRYDSLDWPELTDKAILCLIKYFSDSVRGARIAMIWCLANRGTTDDATLEKITSGICYKMCGDVYNSNILLPTIKHLLPNTTKLKCHHSGKCKSAKLQWKCEIKTVNEKLYKLEPFEDDVARLSVSHGERELTWTSGPGQYGYIFVKGRPYDPFFPLDYTTIGDGALRKVIAALKDNDELMILSNTRV